jgi:hypothetical protein
MHANGALIINGQHTKSISTGSTQIAPAGTPVSPFGRRRHIILHLRKQLPHRRHQTGGPDRFRKSNSNVENDIHTKFQRNLYKFNANSN